MIINAAAYTAVDTAETAEGRREAWAANVAAVSRLAGVAEANGITLVHVSSDYVFDGTRSVHPEDEPFSPLGVYGQTKAAGDAVVAAVSRHYIVRTSWVIGEGKNFVDTMAALAQRGISPKVVDDQIGRLSFTADIAAGIRHLLESEAPYGTYNLSNTGTPRSWADIARSVFELNGRSGADVTGVSTRDYFAGTGAAPRPAQSALDLGRISATGFQPRDMDEALKAHVAGTGQHPGSLTDGME